jgi:hypothetical protein
MNLPEIKLSLASRSKRKPRRTSRPETTTKSASSQGQPEAVEPFTSQGFGPLPTSRLGMNERRTSASTEPKEVATEAKPSERLPHKRAVRFEHEDAKAHGVFLSGSFNDWNPSATQMGLAPNGIWGVELSLSPGRYEYLFVVDRRWTPDPRGTDYLPNPFGGCNSVRQVE